MVSHSLPKEIQPEFGELVYCTVCTLLDSQSRTICIPSLPLSNRKRGFGKHVSLGLNSALLVVLKRPRQGRFARAQRQTLRGLQVDVCLLWAEPWTSWQERWHKRQSLWHATVSISRVGQDDERGKGNGSSSTLPDPCGLLVLSWRTVLGCWRGFLHS